MNEWMLSFHFIFYVLHFLRIIFWGVEPSSSRSRIQDLVASTGKKKMEIATNVFSHVALTEPLKCYVKDQ